MGITYMFITHDLSVVNHVSDDIAVMYLGRLVEKAPSEALFEKPLHPYTEALLSAIPVPRIHNRHKRIMLKGELTSPIDPEPVCRFAVRCNRVHGHLHQGRAAAHRGPAKPFRGLPPPQAHGELRRAAP